MKQEGKTTLTNHHLLAALSASPDIQRLLPSLLIGGVGVVPEETLVRIKRTRVGASTLDHTRAVFLPFYFKKSKTQMQYSLLL